MGDVLAKIVNPDKSSSRPSFRTLLEFESVLGKGSSKVIPDMLRQVWLATPSSKYFQSRGIRPPTKLFMSYHS
ncbi:hypothetical protein TNIN_57381 [Trichonephila inaurata madagascariensis]|uniref:Uncharacterized protein n=1 Tax=Trichonephila inaurata madagascariensis TaxID=2747483 RepID=A0A8X6WZK3_9ARAC|nr:hypothetical protein TNIN_57381 [Trichonephila inaurata madagascariensis]